MLQAVLWWLLAGICVAAAAGALLVFLVRRKTPELEKGSIGFFHPYAHAGGGGERVLWMGVKTLVQRDPLRQIVIYCEPRHDLDSLRVKVDLQFGIQLRGNVRLVPLSHVDLLRAERWPRFTILGQLLGAAWVAWSGLKQFVPEVWLDTTGWASPYPLAWLLGCKVAAYVHYPTVSTDMLARLWQRRGTYNNDAHISSSLPLTALKALYYRLVALLYGALGWFSHVTMVNSSWTRNHIARLWWCSWRRPALVYPPCDVAGLQGLPLRRPLKTLQLVSVAQFRPEKNHRLQLEALERAKEQLEARGCHAVSASLRLHLVGGCRHEDDMRRLEGLQRLAETLGVSHQVQFHPNAEHETMQRLLGSAIGGLHTMVDEHFGISLVEYMAAGCVVIANNSGGPRLDIVYPAVQQRHHPRDAVGFLASSAAEYAACIVDLVTMSERARMEMAQAARSRAGMFSDAGFAHRWLSAMAPLL